MASRSEIAKALDMRRRDNLLELIGERPELMIKDLISDTSIADLAGSISMSEIGEALVGSDVANRGGNRRNGHNRNGRGGNLLGNASKLNLRTPQAREAYDSAVLGALRSKGDKMSAADLRRAAGGDEYQIRASLNRMIEAGAVDYAGNTAAMRYWAKE